MENPNRLPNMYLKRTLGENTYEMMRRIGENGSRYIVFKKNNNIVFQEDYKSTLEPKSVILLPCNKMLEHTLNASHLLICGNIQCSKKEGECYELLSYSNESVGSVISGYKFCDGSIWKRYNNGFEIMEFGFDNVMITSSYLGNVRFWNFNKGLHEDVEIPCDLFDFNGSLAVDIEFGITIKGYEITTIVKVYDDGRKYMQYKLNKKLLFEEYDSQSHNIIISECGTTIVSCDDDPIVFHVGKICKHDKCFTFFDNDNLYGYIFDNNNQYRYSREENNSKLLIVDPQCPGEALCEIGYSCAKNDLICYGFDAEGQWGNMTSQGEIFY
ncbi:MAG: hypothetical protein AAFO15_01480 [Pseudomonadota bacterium]